MTPDERIAAIRERVSDPRFTRWTVWTSQDYADINWLLDQWAILRAVAEAAERTVSAWDNSDGMFAHELVTHVSDKIDALAAALVVLEQEPPTNAPR